MVAASSTAERRVGNTPRFAKARAPSADARVKVAGKCNRDRCQNCRQFEMNDVGMRHLEKYREIAHCAQNRLLLGVHDMGGTDEFRACGRTWCVVRSP
jgi:hypothetical protein